MKLLIKINLSSWYSYNSVQNFNLKFSLFIVSDSSTRLWTPKRQTPTLVFLLSCVPCITLHGTWCTAACQQIFNEWTEEGKKENILEYVLF